MKNSIASTGVRSDPGYRVDERPQNRYLDRRRRKGLHLLVGADGSADFGRDRRFTSGDSDRLETVTDPWRRRLNKVFAPGREISPRLPRPDSVIRLRAFWFSVACPFRMSRIDRATTR